MNFKTKPKPQRYAQRDYEITETQPEIINPHRFENTVYRYFNVSVEVRLQAQRLTVLADGPLPIVLRLKCIADVVVRLGIDGLQSQCLTVLADGPIPVPLVVKRNAQAEVLLGLSFSLRLFRRSAFRLGFLSRQPFRLGLLFSLVRSFCLLSRPTLGFSFLAFPSLLFCCFSGQTFGFC